MKKIQISLVVLLFALLGASAVSLADENPIDLKQSQNAWVVWTDGINNQPAIFASRWNGEKWGEKVQVSSEAHSNIAPSVALDRQGNPWVVWSGRDGVSSSIYYSRFDGEKWSEESLLTSADEREDVTPAIAFDAQGKALAVWGSVDGASSDIRAREWNGSQWGPEVTLTAEDNAPDMVPAVAFAAEGTAVVAWTGMDNGTSQIFAAIRSAQGEWGSEAVIDPREVGFGQDLPTLKMEGETLKLYYEQDNQFYASHWSEKGWSRGKIVDLSNSFYNVVQGIPGELGGRAWFAWVNTKGLASSFRYNVVTHDLVLRQGAKAQRFTWLRRLWQKASGTVAWLFSPSEALANGKKKSDGDKFDSRAAFGDSIVAGSTGESFVPFWNGSALNFGVGGLRATSLPGQVSSRMPQGTESIVLNAGTNDIGDGRAIGDIVGALNGGVAEAKNKGAKRVTTTTNIPRQDIFAGGVEALASAIRNDSAGKVADTFKALQGNIGQFTIDAVGHLNNQGARKVGKVVKKKAG